MLNYEYQSPPPGWTVKYLAEVTRFLDSQRIPIEAVERQERQGIYPYYGASGVIDYIDGFLFDDDLILLAEDGANILDRSTPIAFRVSGKFWVNNHAHVLKPKQNVEIGYLVNYLESLTYEKFNTGSAQPKLNRRICEKIPVLLPPIQEQKRIAEILATWDEAITLTEREIEAKQKRKMALMQKLLTGKLRFQQFAMEDEWLSGHFVDIAEIVMGQSPDGSTYNQQGVGVPLLNGPTEFGERYPTKIQWTTSPTKFCKKGDILLCVRGSSTGRTNIADSEYCIGRGIAAIRAKSGKSITSYLEQNLIFGIQKLLSLTSGSTFPNIDKKSIGQIPLVIPSVEEQKLIATVLSLADEEIQKLQQQVKQFQKQKQGLMQKLLTGEWRLAVQEAA